MFKIQNSKQKQWFETLRFRISNLFRISIFEFRISQQKGITLLLVIVLLTAILSISIGVFMIVYGQLLISGEIGSSFIALYAADQAIEKMLYLDRPGNKCDPPNPSCNVTNLAAENPLACYTTDLQRQDLVSPAGNDTTVIRVTGDYPCNAQSSREVKRAFDVEYPWP